MVAKRRWSVLERNEGDAKNDWSTRWEPTLPATFYKWIWDQVRDWRTSTWMDGAGVRRCKLKGLLSQSSLTTWDQLCNFTAWYSTPCDLTHTKRWLLGTLWKRSGTLKWREDEFKRGGGKVTLEIAGKFSRVENHLIRTKQPRPPFHFIPTSFFCAAKSP